ESHQDVLPILLLAVDTSMRAGDLNAARDVAAVACRNFPASVPAARTVAELQALSERWDAAVAAGIEWRTRAMEHDPNADAFVVRMLLNSGRAAEAVSSFDERARAAMSKTEANEPF